MLFPATCRLASTGKRIAAHQATVHDFDARGIKTCFGLDEQLALMASLHGSSALSHIVGRARTQTFGRKGQAIMRDLAWLTLTQMWCCIGDYLSEIQRTTSGKHCGVIGMTGHQGTR